MLKYSTHSNVKHLVDKLEWVIVPVVNIDGYTYTRTTVSKALCVPLPDKVIPLYLIT